jgi:hypothetical protein
LKVEPGLQPDKHALENVAAVNAVVIVTASAVVMVSATPGVAVVSVGTVVTVLVDIVVVARTRAIRILNFALFSHTL